MSDEQDTHFGRLTSIRRRFHRERSEEPASFLDRLHDLGRFLRLAVRKAADDDLRHESAALAFITILSLIPLMAAFSLFAFGAQALSKEVEQHKLVVDLLSQILPYSEDVILSNLDRFLDQTKTLGGFSFAIVLFTSLAAFMTIERTLNRVWSVPNQRPFRTRLLHFTLLLFWGPLLIGATYTSLYFLRHHTRLDTLARSVPAQLIPFVVTLLGLTMLYWMVPYTTVRFRSALGGGLLAAALLEALRHGFKVYVDHFSGFSLIYGSLGLALFFMISIQLSWWIVLLGTETAYCIQNYEHLVRPRWRSAPIDGSWVALAALVFITERFRTGEPVTPSELLAERLRLPVLELREVLRPLFDAGLLRETTGDDGGYLLSCDPYGLEIARVFELYEEVHWEMLDSLPGVQALGLEELRARLADARGEKIEGVLLSELVPASKSAPKSLKAVERRGEPRTENRIGSRTS